MCECEEQGRKERRKIEEKLDTKSFYRGRDGTPPVTNFKAQTGFVDDVFKVAIVLAIKRRLGVFNISSQASEPPVTTRLDSTQLDQNPIVSQFFLILLTPVVHYFLVSSQPVTLQFSVHLRHGPGHLRGTPDELHHFQYAVSRQT